VEIPDPWNEFIRKVGIGDVLEGKVVTVKEYGAFVEVAPGVVGLLHVRDAIVGRVKTAEEIFSPGQDVQVKIIDIIPEEKRVRFALTEKIRPGRQKEKALAGKGQAGEDKQPSS
jgi:small subunit ribosomal protein S1